MPSNLDRLFVDTGDLIARFNRRDQFRARVVALDELLASCRELWTTDAVLLEG